MDRKLRANDGNFFWRCLGQADGTGLLLLEENVQPLNYPWRALITFICVFKLLTDLEKKTNTDFVAM